MCEDCASKFAPGATFDPLPQNGAFDVHLFIKLGMITNDSVSTNAAAGADSHPAADIDRACDLDIIGKNSIRGNPPMILPGKRHLDSSFPVKAVQMRLSVDFEISHI